MLFSGDALVTYDPSTRRRGPRLLVEGVNEDYDLARASLESRAKLAGHAVRPMLITVPLGLLGTAVVFDLLDLLTDADTLAMAAFYMIAAGILGGLLAAVFGLWDWLAIPADTRPRRIGLWHGLGNAVVLVLFALVWIMRRGQIDYQPTGLALWLEGIAVLVALAPAWAGGELVERLGVGWTRARTLDAPSSCVARP